MRKSVLAFAALAVAIGGAVLPATAPTAHAAGGPKVAIIVGATHSATSQYRSYANQVYAEAIKYTSNVVKVYSPNATWTAVKSAVNGASIVVYMGHGNGWPSPYTYDPNYTTKDGFGLNAVAGQGDANNKYYGEPSIRTLTPAPNAVVLLMHLCYASGNSEPGDADPSLSVAKQRVDNYAAAFLRTNAKAVIADGHVWDHAYYIRALFTSRQSIDDVFRNAPNSNANYVTYPSARNTGLTYTMDPDAPGKGFYRSIAGKMSLTTQQVTGAAYAATDTDPSTFVAPGAASAAVDAAPVYADAAAAIAGTSPVGTLALDARVRVDAIGANGPDAKPLVTMHTLDGSMTGVMRGSTLVPRDSQGPRTWDVEDGTGAFSPNGDGSQDTYPLDVALSESSAWTLRVTDGGGDTLATASGTGSHAVLAWDGRHAGDPVDDGTYAWHLTAEDAWGNPALADEGSFEVDTVAPSLGEDALTPAAVSGSLLTFSPNADGYKDTVSVGVTATEPATLEATMRDAGDTAVADLAVTAPSGSATIVWNGRTSSGSYVGDGVYTLRVVARDAAGNRSGASTLPIGVHKALTGVRTSGPNFWPNDGDAYSKWLGLSFELKSTQHVTWRIVDAAGNTVRMIADDVSMAAGTHSYTFDGKGTTGAYLPRGTYRSIVTATNGTLTSALAATFVQDLFRISVSDTTPARGQTVTVTVVSAETLSKLPRLTVLQPGASSWAVTMSHVSGRTYKVTIKLKSGQAGTMKLLASGYDSASKYGSSGLSLPIH